MEIIPQLVWKPSTASLKPPKQEQEVTETRRHVHNYNLLDYGTIGVIIQFHIKRRGACIICYSL